jgi:hypothetical protein
MFVMSNSNGAKTGLGAVPTDVASVPGGKDAWTILGWNVSMRKPALIGRSFRGSASTALLVSCVLVACQSSPAVQEPNALYVPPQASEVRWAKEFDGTVAYVLDEDFPATHFLQRASERLAGAGFSPVPTDLFDPKIENSHSRGWGDYLDGDDTVFAWVGDWKNQRGDHVRYDLRYRVRLGDPAPRRRLAVTGTYLDAATVMRVEATNLGSPRK